MAIKEININQLSEGDKRYIACAVDTDGWLGCSRQKRGKNKHEFSIAPQLNIRMVSYNFLDNLRQITNLGILFPVKNHPDKKWKMQWFWYLSPWEIKVLLPQIKPYLIIKKEQPKLIMELIEMNERNRRLGKSARSKEDTQRLLEIHAELHKLNRRGKIKILGNGK